MGMFKCEKKGVHPKWIETRGYQVKVMIPQGVVSQGRRSPHGPLGKVEETGGGGGGPGGGTGGKAEPKGRGEMTVGVQGKGHKHYSCSAFGLDHGIGSLLFMTSGRKSSARRG